ncbi:MAG: CAP domain-containing protein [Saprospiraceae bacterium]|nr:CAP domain-containing protein [Saprospiraceae bacterium]
MKKSFNTSRIVASSAILLIAAFILSAFSWDIRPIAADSKDEVIRLINEYRNSGNYNTNIANWSPSNCLIAAPATTKGNLTLEVNPDLMHAAQMTAEKFASGEYNYDKAHHQKDPNGINGPMVRAIKDGFWPRWNELYTAATTPPFTGIMENLFKGPENLSPASVVEGWKKSPGHNYTLLRASAYSMGVGMAEGNGQSYWVFLIESEYSMDDTQENLSKYFGMGRGFDFRAGATPDPNGKAGDVFDWVEGIADKIKNER